MRGAADGDPDDDVHRDQHRDGYGYAHADPDTYADADLAPHARTDQLFELAGGAARRIGRIRGLAAEPAALSATASKGPLSRQ